VTKNLFSTSLRFPFAYLANKRRKVAIWPDFVKYHDSGYDLAGGEMNSTDSTSSAQRGTKHVRVLLIINFLLLLALIGPGNSHRLYLAERRLGLAHIIVQSLQFWFVAATVLVTVLFVRMLVSKSEAQRPTKLDWALFLGWWFVVAILCLFAFMAGMGG
jgi:hypothetical protein